jgi:hypothetical protein
VRRDAVCSSVPVISLCWIIETLALRMGIIDSHSPPGALTSRLYGGRSEEHKGVSDPCALLTRYYNARQLHRGGIVRNTGSTGVGRHGTQSVDASQWSWAPVKSCPWHYTEHINVPEARAYGLALRWRARNAQWHGQRFVHLLDSQVVLGAQAKGRSSSVRQFR